MSHFVKPIKNVKPVPTVHLETSGGFKTEVSDPSADCYNLLSDGGGGSNSDQHVERAYALLSGFDIAQARDAGTLRVDQDFTGIPIGSGQALNNHAATLSNSMFTKAGTVIMSEQRAVRLNTGLRQFMVNLGSPERS